MPWIPGKEQPGRISLFETWPGGRPGIDVKTPTAVLMNGDHVVAWGFQALTQAVRSRANRPGSGVRLLHGFKMSLAPKSHADTERTSEIGLADNEPRPEKLIEGFLTHVYATALSELRDRFPGLREDEVRWCITVPAMWGDREKHLVRQAAHRAGFPRGENGDQLLLALEPDAVAHNAQVSGVQYVLDVDGQTRGSLERNSRFMVVDAGGGTIDITCYHTDEHGYLAEVDRDGIAQSSLYVNRALTDLVLVDRLGGPDEFRRLRKDAPHALEELLHEWEIAKRTVTADSTDTIWLSLKMSLAKHLTDEVIDRITDSQDGDNENIWISADEARSAFDAVIPDILALIDRKLADMTALADVEEKPVLVLMAGGFAESAYLRHRVAQHLRGRAVVAVTPQPRVDVVEGAVRFAYNPKVRARRAQYTYGTDTCMAFEHGVDPIDSLYRSPLSGDNCNKRFAVFINAGDLVPVTHEVRHHYYPTEPTQDALEFDFYRTKERNPRYVDNEGCEEFSGCKLVVDITEAMHLDIDKRGVTLYIKFGETELHVRAVLDFNGKEHPVSLQFSTR
ncbi:hypothetical protein BB31_41605 [Amycolatopsis lurida NRRL 2430]|uniref:Hsp70 family protein n=1 Tax=Amycolatopsis lurida NRRL 2430 TaxID=1460371 RepID=A0A2P2FFB1_AMYLU|nr:hypothetical protein BB31_41605 [Amycolatopsis lurida NRRL 2430]